MTQGIFKTAEAVKQERKSQLKERAMKLWRVAGPDYRMLPLKYEALLEEKKARGIRPLAKLRKEVIASYPKIPFLLATSEEEVKALLDKWEKQGCLYAKIERIEEILRTDNSINSIKAWCRDYSYNISRLEYAKEKERRMKEMPPKKKEKDNLAEFMAGTMA